MKFNNTNYILFFIAFILLSMCYKKLKLDESTNTSAYYLNMVNKFLLNKNSLGMSNKPYLWIHLHNDTTIIPDVNSRKWLTFGSRNTIELNQPYQYLTIKSIIDKCGDDFNINLIDDNSFKKIIPNWSIDLNTIAIPIRSHMRRLALANVLSIYGGILVPSSFICIKSLKPLYDANINENKMFVGEFVNRTSSASNTSSSSFIPFPKFMGCPANNDEMKEFVKFLEIMNSSNFTAEPEFIGRMSDWLNDAVNKQQINNINGLFLGTKKSCGNPILVEELVGSTYINLSNDAFGLYILWEELIQRTALKWFVRMSPQQILESDTMIGKYLLVNQ